MDAGNMLKPMLARGELRMIGATTLDEYRKHIEKDAALERRFQPVFVGEPIGRGHHRHPARPEGALRGAPRRAHPGLRPRVARPCCPTATSPAASCPTRPSTSSTRPPPSCASRSTRCRPRSTSSSGASSSSRSSRWRWPRRPTSASKERLAALDEELAALQGPGRRDEGALGGREGGHRRHPHAEGGARGAAHPARARARPREGRRDPLRPHPRARAPHRRRHRAPRPSSRPSDAC